MCTSIVQGIYMIGLIVGAVLLVTSIFTPGWLSNNFVNGTYATNMGVDGVSSLTTSVTTSKGLFQCPNIRNATLCKQYFDAKPTWERAAIVLMLLALVGCGFAFAWSCVVCMVCCCKGCLTPPLPIITGMTTLLLVVALALYGGYNQEAFKQEWNGVIANNGKPPSYTEFGYSIYLGVASALVLLADTIVAIILVKTSQVVPF